MRNSDASAEDEPRKARVDEKSSGDQSLEEPLVSQGGQLVAGAKGERRSGMPAHRPSGVSQSARSSPTADLYEMAYEASQRGLDDQQDELGRMRDRSVNFAAFIGAATAFLVGTGLQTPHRDWVFVLLACLASACSLVFICLLFFLLNPSTKNKWRARVSAQILISEWIEVDIPPTKAQLTKGLALSTDGAAAKNEVLLTAIRRWYRWLILSGSAQVTLWAALVWIKH